MTTVVLSSADLVQATETGMIPMPPEVKADNEARAAKKEGGDAKGDSGQLDSGGVQKAAGAESDSKGEKSGTEEAKSNAVDTDDIEGEDGLTPRQKREFTAAMQKTIAKKHRMQREAEELALRQYNETQLAEQAAEELRAEITRLKAAQPKPEPKPVVEAKAPERKDFETDQAYQDALIDFRVDQRLKAQAAAEAKRQAEQHMQEVIQHAAARIERAIELVPDFKEVTEAVDLEVPPVIAGYMQESDMFAELGYHFAKNPEVLTRLQKMNPARALVEVGKIEGTLQPFSKEKVSNGEAPEGEAPSSKNGKEPSTETGSAPSKPRVQAPIIKPLNTGSAAQVEKDEADMTGSQVVRNWQKKHKVNLTARKRH